MIGLGIAITQPAGGIAALALVPTASFPLKKSIVADIGSSSLTFTRATTATVVDWEGLVRTALSGEVRFAGQRRVQNLLTGSATLSTQSVTTIAGTYVFAMEGTGSVTFSGTSSGSLSGTAGQRKAITLTTTAGSLTITVTGTVTNAQLENVTGQSNQNPADYVDSATDYGANVQGVRYFDTQNGNTVAANVVTTATGAALTDTDAAPTGYLAEPAATNLCLWSEAFDNAAWSTINASVSANVVAGPSGAVTADKLVEAAGLNTHSMFQGFTVTANTVYTVAVLVKKAERSVLRLQWAITGATDAVYCDIDANAGTIVNTGFYGAGTYTGSAIRALGNGYYMVWLAGKCNASATAAFIFPMLRDSSSNAASFAACAYNGDGTSGLYLGGAMVMVGNMIGQSYIATTSTSVTRNADALTGPVGVYNDAAGTVVFKAQMTFQAATLYQRLVGVPANPFVMVQGGSGVISAYDGTNQIDISKSIVSRKTISVAWGGGTMRIASNGTAASGSYDGGWNGSSTIAIGRSGSDNATVPAILSNLAFYSKKASAAQQDALVA